MRDSLCLLLRLQGFCPQAYASAEAFLDQIDEQLRGLVLLDLRLPGMTGLDVQTHARQPQDCATDL